MSNVIKRLADAMVQAAREGDDSPKYWVSERVLEIALSAPAPVISNLPYRGDGLRAALKLHGRSQTALADRLGIHVSAVSKICSNDRDVSASEAEIISAYLTETESH